MANFVDTTLIPAAAAGIITATGLAALSACPAKAAELPRGDLVYRCQIARQLPEFIEGNPAITLNLTKWRFRMGGQAGSLQTKGRLLTFVVHSEVKIQISLGDPSGLRLTRPELVAGMATVSTDDRTDGGKPVACVRR